MMTKKEIKEELMKRIPPMIDRMMRERGIKDEELARETGRALKTVQSWRKGKTIPLDLEIYWAMTDLFDIRMVDFFGFFDQIILKHPAT